MHFIEMPEQADITALQLAVSEARHIRNNFRRLKWFVFNIGVVDNAALIHCGQKCRAPKRAAYRQRLGRCQYDVARKVFVLGAEAISDPGTHRWAAYDIGSGVHHRDAWLMVRN